MSKKALNIDDELSRCINQLLLKEPFFSHILSGTVRSITTEIPTAAVGIRNGHVLLMVNQDFFLSELKSTSQRVAVLKHETLHLVFKHLFREQIREDMELMNFAADIVVNQYIGEWELPETAITLETFPDMDLEAGQSMEYYFEKLSSLKDKKSAAKKKTKSPHPISKKAFDQLYGAQRHSDHSGWVDAKNMPMKAGIREMLDNQLLNAAARTSAKQFGQLPGDLQRMIELIREERKPKVDWKRQLRLFASSNGKSYVSFTMKRISKRYGTRPGIRIRRKNRVAVVIDSSGSIGQDLLNVFMAEVEGIHRSGAEVTIIESDCKVQQVFNFRRGMELKIKGGGGTDFDPAFEYINSGKSGIFDACIYLTDGVAGEPEVRPRTKVLWVLPPDGCNEDHLKWGRRIVIQ